MNRKSIHQLSQSLVNRIAAGEVIERPASVVKELVENAVDAGASNIVVEIEDGGRALIRVIDDGNGIPVEELPLAFAPHATSKLLSDEDLFNISTMGFRGEALASIGAVSHARLLSRTRESQAAWEIFDRGGDMTQPQAAAGNVGTTIEIRNLFFNTPARRKFIKGVSTEFGHISDMTMRLAMPYPQVSFKLRHNDRLTLELPATGFEQRLLAAWPEEFHEQRLPLELRDAEIGIRGVIGLPDLARPVAKHQYLFLNGRYIRDRFIQHALREAYRGLCEPGRHPAAILLLEIPPTDVDVNVHPTKIEVRFKDSGRIHGLVLSGIREKLLGSDLTPSAVPMRTDAHTDLPREELRHRLADFFRQGPSGLPIGSTTTDAFLPFAPARPYLSAFLNSPPGPAMIATSIYGDEPPRSEISTAPAEGMSDDSTLSTSAPMPDMANAQAVPPVTVPAIQLHNTYLVAQSEDGLVIIDQHALHERILFEDLLARVTRGPLEAQRLLIPITLNASEGQMAMLEQIRALLGKLGIDVSAFGPATLAIQSFPSFMEKLDPSEFVQAILDRGEQELLDLREEELLHELLDMMSCKAAVKAGDPLSRAEIEALLARRELVERSSNCPHGRPTTLRLTLRDLEKQFKRSGF